MSVWNHKVLVVGGGAAGMMAAGMAAKAGAKVILFEKNDRLGKKLAITGKGRCNVANDCSADEVLKNWHGSWNKDIKKMIKWLTIQSA